MGLFGVPRAGKRAAAGRAPARKGAYEQMERRKGKGRVRRQGLLHSPCLLPCGSRRNRLLYPPQQPTTPEPSDTPVLQPEWTVPSQPEPDDADEPAAPTMEPAQPEDLLPQVVSPLDGTTVTVFSTTELLYDETMADWRTHSGIDIQAAEGDSVKTAASGKVVKVEDDELMGTTVVIEHAGGYSTQYSCLQKDPPVTVGQEVAAGDVIGQVGSTASAETEMGAHLHFSVSKDGKVIDPSEYVGD